MDLSEIKGILVDHPQTIVLWGADHRKTGEFVGETLTKLSAPARVFALTEDPVHSYSYLLKHACFGHHIYRKFTKATPIIYSRVVGASVTPFPFGLERYVGVDSKVQKITLKKSSQKNAAVDAIQNVFSKCKVPSRLAALGAKAADELIMNAIFDAPTDGKGQQTRLKTPRDSDFVLFDKEEVDVEFSFCPEYFALGVSDQFGSIKKKILLDFITQDFSKKAYLVRKENPGAGLGLHGIIGGGLSAIFICKPGIRTQVILFFENVENFRDFKNSFQFLSILAE